MKLIQILRILVADKFLLTVYLFQVMLSVVTSMKKGNVSFISESMKEITGI